MRKQTHSKVSFQESDGDDLKSILSPFREALLKKDSDEALDIARLKEENRNLQKQLKEYEKRNQSLEFELKQSRLEKISLTTLFNELFLQLKIVQEKLELSLKENVSLEQRIQHLVFQLQASEEKLKMALNEKQIQIEKTIKLRTQFEVSVGHFQKIINQLKSEKKTEEKSCDEGAPKTKEYQEEIKKQAQLIEKIEKELKYWKQEYAIQFCWEKNRSQLFLPLSNVSTTSSGSETHQVAKIRH